VTTLEEYSRVYLEFTKADHRLTSDIRNLCNKVVQGIDSYPDGVLINTKGAEVHSDFKEVIDGSKCPNANDVTAGAKAPPSIRKH